MILDTERFARPGLSRATPRPGTSRFLRTPKDASHFLRPRRPPSNSTACLSRKTPNSAPSAEPVPRSLLSYPQVLTNLPWMLEIRGNDLNSSRFCKPIHVANPGPAASDTPMRRVGSGAAARGTVITLPQSRCATNYPRQCVINLDLTNDGEPDCTCEATTKC